MEWRAIPPQLRGWEREQFSLSCWVENKIELGQTSLLSWVRGQNCRIGGAPAAFFEIEFNVIHLSSCGPHPCIKIQSKFQTQEHPSFSRKWGSICRTTERFCSHGLVKLYRTKDTILAYTRRKTFIEAGNLRWDAGLLQAEDLGIQLSPSVWENGLNS